PARAGDVPQLDSPGGVPGGEQLPGSECDGVAGLDRCRWHERRPGLPTLRNIPQPNATVVADRRELLAVGAEGDVVHRTDRTAKEAQDPARSLCGGQQERAPERSRMRPLRLESKEQREVEPLAELSLRALHERTRRGRAL